MNLNNLTNDLRYALIAAEVAIAGIPDNGTSNFDRPVLLKNEQFRRYDRAVESAIEAAGFIPFWDRGWNAGWHLSGFPGGQGATRTLAAETIRDFLKLRGWEASVHYQMD